MRDLVSIHKIGFRLLRKIHQVDSLIIPLHLLNVCFSLVRVYAGLFLTAGMIAGILAFIFENPRPQDFINGILPLAYAGILSSGVGYTLQVIGQKDMDPTVASLILSLESVFSVLSGWIILGQALSAKEMFGCVMVFGAVVLVQLPDRKKEV